MSVSEERGERGSPAPPNPIPKQTVNVIPPPFEGQLNKFTNVVKGWQYRWFVLDTEAGTLAYHLMDERHLKSRGTQHLSGSVVIPSDEDSVTFSVSFASGDVFKVRAANAKERQIWVDQIRAVCHRHDTALASATGGKGLNAAAVQMPPTPPGSRSHISSNGQPASDALQHLSLSVLDAFGSAHDIIHQMQIKNKNLGKSIELLPQSSSNGSPAPSSNSSNSPGSLDEDLLLLKATSHAALYSMEEALSILQEFRETRLGPLAATTHHPHRQPNKFPMMMTTMMNPVNPAAAVVNSPKRSLPSPTKSAAAASMVVKKQSTSSSPGGLSVSTSSLPTNAAAAATSARQQSVSSSSAGSSSAGS